MTTPRATDAVTFHVRRDSARSRGVGIGTLLWVALTLPIMVESCREEVAVGRASRVGYGSGRGDVEPE
jgi:hypothetical protein